MTCECCDRGLPATKIHGLYCCEECDNFDEEEEVVVIRNGDFADKKHTNAVIALAMRNNFYVEQVWNMLLRKLSPRVAQQLLKEGYTKEELAEVEKRSFAKYDNFNWEFRLLMKEDKVIGFSFWDFPKKAGKGCCLEFLLVDEAERGKGHGKSLMDEYDRWTIANGRTNNKIQFIPTPKLMAFYTAYGFRDCGVVERGDIGSDVVCWYRGDIVPK
jgi:GNAT superfamily N-acetyltransferase